MLMRKITILASFMAAAALSFAVVTNIFAQTPLPISTASPSAELETEPSPTPRPDLTKETEETIGPLEKLLEGQELGSIWPFNPLKHAIRSAVGAGVPPNTIVLLLLLPIVAAVIAAARHLIGIRGFGIFLPAALSVVFVATGPIIGIILFLIIVFVSSIMRIIFKETKIKLQYLPRMALVLLFVVFGVLGLLFAAPIIKQPGLSNVSIFPVLILVLLAEDVSRVQMGKSAKTAINLTTETLILALLSYIFLTLEPLQKFALLNPEIIFLSVAVFDFMIGKYVGLRFIEFWRFRKLISG
jgi:hypothetical protein